MAQITSKKTYPCMPAELSQLDELITHLVFGGPDAPIKLFAAVCPITPDRIPWGSVHTLAILGAGDPECNQTLEASPLRPGVYINRTGEWMLLVHPQEDGLQETLDRFGPRLKTLSMYCTTLTTLDLSALRSLEVLDTWKNLHIIVLLGLENLKQLTSLYLSGCSSLVQIPGLENLQRLTRLDLFGCSSLEHISGLENLKQLTSLELSRCKKLTVLPDGLGRLRSLRRLDLSHMELKTLPDWLPDIAEGFNLDKFTFRSGSNRAIIHLYDTTVADMPDMSIFTQPYEMVAQWFRDRKNKNTQLLNEIKVVFLGDGEAGKSHTIARLMNNGGEPEDYTDQSTPGIVIKHQDYTLENRKFRVHYWDFGGQEIMHSMHRIFLTNRTMYVVLLNARDDTQGDRAHYWLHNIKSFAPDAPVLLVLNKIDQNENASVNEVDLHSRYQKLTQIVRLSAKTFDRDQFNSVFTDVLLAEIQKTGYLDAQWSTGWTRVKQRLESMTDHYIMGDRYQTICEECQVDDNQKNLLHWFNDLGISFCCCDEEDYALEDYVILRPDWITNALYIILFNRLEDAKNGLIPHKSIHTLLKAAYKNPEIRSTMPLAKYTSGDIQYVLGVMRKFKLSFPHGSDSEFIPMLCQQNSTIDVQYYHQDTDTLEFTMDFDYLPNNLLHRLMVDRNTELDMDNVWRTGARFELKELGLSAVVVIDGSSLRFFIRHENNTHRPNTYLTMLKANVDRIVARMGLNPPACQLIYKQDGRQDVFDYETLKAMLEAGQPMAFSMAWRRMIPIDDIFNQSAPDELVAEHRLLNTILKVCEHIQREPEYRGSKEDIRNRRMRDALEIAKYKVHDQTQIGTSGSKKDVGELDLMLYRGDQIPWSIIEALRVRNGSKHDWNLHLAKLLDNYNPHGVPFLFLITYADCAKKSFDDIWNGYKSHIQEHPSGDFAYVDQSYETLTGLLNNHYLQIARSQYRCGDYTPTVYHIFVQMDLKPEAPDQ